jgi:hypothetical protein
MTEEEINKAIELYVSRQVINKVELAKMFGIGKCQLTKIFKERGVTIVGRSRIINREDYPMVLDWSNYETTKTKLPCECQRCGKLIDRTIKSIDVANGICHCTVCAQLIVAEKFGVPSTLLLESSKEKTIKTKMEKYGDVNYSNRAKATETCKERYGVENPSQVKKFHEKKIQTCLKNRGTEYPAQHKDVQKKMQDTCEERFGTRNAFQSDEIKQKISDLCMKEHNVLYSCLTDQCIEANKITFSKVNQWWYDLLMKKGVLVRKEFCMGAYSYDFHVLGKNILIEINPTYTHNSTITFMTNTGGGQPKNKDYHFNKSQFAKNNGYHLIHVWDWDESEKIVNLVKPRIKIGARECEIVELDIFQCNTFFNAYHLQNSVSGKIIKCFGLIYNIGGVETIVQAMSFGTPRYNKKYQWELLRLASDPRFKIVGGSERLFSRFVKVYKPSSVISYCDNSKFNGDVYEKLGFVEKGQDISKHWYNLKNHRHITDNLLRQRGADQLIGTSDGKGISNETIMIREGYLEIYDAGQTTYVKTFLKSVGN